MFTVTLVKIDKDFNEVTWEGWFTTAHVKKNLKDWQQDYDRVTIKKATVAVLSVVGVEGPSND